MKFKTKQRIVMAGILVLALWPLLHVGVVRLTGISPWRGFGWGTYTVPVLKVDIRVRPVEGQAGQPASAEMDSMLDSMKRYMKRYQVLGANAKPRRVARAVFASYPGLTVIEISAARHRLDRKSALVTENPPDLFRYRRRGDGRIEQLEESDSPRENGVK